jgi:ABC-2 type transport system ATP-binding protein
VTDAITVDRVGKFFRRYKERPTSLKERIVKFRLTSEQFWALRDLSFTVPEGQTLGLLGPNGSGKTTMLKIIAGILRANEGQVTTRGRIASLLALGAGFHRELTGRENVYLNASIMGLTRKETDARFDDIVEFAELRDFIDNQVKFYSDGMYVRLGFAVAVHVDPSILLVDEVLAVGDIGFQQKCLAKIQEFQEDGRTIVFVTHSPELVLRVCDSVVLLEHGRMVTQGNPRDTVRDFRALMHRDQLAYGWDQGNREIEIVSAEIFGRGGETRDLFAPGDGLVIQVDLKATRPIPDPIVSFAIHDEENRKIYETSSNWRGVTWPVFEGKHRVQFVLESLPFIDGRYFVTLGVHSRDTRTVYHLHEQHYAFDVVRGAENPGLVWIPVECRTEPL